MKTMKKLTALILAIIMILGATVTAVYAASYSDVAQGKYYADDVEILSTYGVISGFDGKFRPGAQITRAEFSKITAVIAGLEDEVYTNAGRRKFDDVQLESWATGYINTAANNKLIVGYPNGKFMPNKSITYAEAVTVVLRVLGYSTEELGDNWPYAYMVKAKSLGLTEGLAVSDNKPISRADVCVIVNRALDEEMNGTTQKLISKLDITTKEDVFIISTKQIEPELASNEVRTDMGVFKTEKNVSGIKVPSKGTVYFNADNRIIRFEETEKITQTVTKVENVLNNDIYFADGTSCLGLGVTKNTGVFNEGTLTTYGAFRNSIQKGARVTVAFDAENTVKLLIVGNAEYTDAVTVYSDIYTALAGVGVSREQIDKAEIFRDGYAAKVEDVKLYDVAYYLEEDSKIYLYSDKVSGTYNEAYPSKANVSSIDISGSVFEIETTTATNKLGEKPGSYKIGARITALLGMDGKIVDIVSANDGDRVNYGVVLSYTVETSEDVLDLGKQQNYINILDGEGKLVKYKTANVEKGYIGRVGKIVVDENGYASFEHISKTTNVYGAIDRNNKKIGDNWLTDDCVIIERMVNPHKPMQEGVTAQVIDFEDITLNEIKKDNVLFAVTTGTFDDISLLIVDDLSTEKYVYGIVKSSKGNTRGTSVSGSYEVFANGSMHTYSTGFYKSVESGTAVSMLVNGNALESIDKIKTVVTNKKVSVADFSRIKIESKVYSLADDVQVIKKSSSGYLAMAKSEIQSLTGKTVSLFADADTEDGGLIRIILVMN